MSDYRAGGYLKQTRSRYKPTWKLNLEVLAEADPEGRPCARPTTHRLIEVFASTQRHEVRVGDRAAQVVVTKLTKVQRSIIRLLGLDPRTYGLS